MNCNDDDFGYFGTGLTGYAHYTQAMKDSSGGGGGNRYRGPRRGTPWWLILFIVSGVIILCSLLEKLF